MHNALPEHTSSFRDNNTKHSSFHDFPARTALAHTLKPSSSNFSDQLSSFFLILFLRPLSLSLSHQAMTQREKSERLVTADDEDFPAADADAAGTEFSPANVHRVTHKQVLKTLSRCCSIPEHTVVAVAFVWCCLFSFIFAFLYYYYIQSSGPAAWWLICAELSCWSVLCFEGS